MLKILKKFTSKSKTVFDLILKKKIPADIIYEDNKILCFKTIEPFAPIHVLIIPKEKKNLDKLENCNKENIEILGYMLYKTSEIAKILNLKEGYRVIINNGENGGQTVFHLHIHLLGGKKLSFNQL